jgi:ABC-2 type transport system permease protein
MSATATAAPGTNGTNSTNSLPEPGFGAAFGAEWAKLRTTRWPRRNVILGAVLGLGVAVLVAFAVGVSYDDLTAAERADHDPTGPALAGAIVPGLFLTVVGVKAITTEYASGMIRLTLTATPRRGRVLAAKALAVASLAWAATAVAMAAMVLATQVILGAYDAPGIQLGDADALRAVGMTWLLAPLLPILGFAAGVLCRGTAAALVSVLALALAPSVLGMLPGWWQRNVLSLFPGPASDSLTVGHIEPSDVYLHPVAAALVVAAWLAASLALARVVFARRDA